MTLSNDVLCSSLLLLLLFYPPCALHSVHSAIYLYSSSSSSSSTQCICHINIYCAQIKAQNATKIRAMQGSHCKLLCTMSFPMTLTEQRASASVFPSLPLVLFFLFLFFCHLCLLLSDGIYKAAGFLLDQVSELLC